MKKARIIDVAEHAGVSKSTVSQYLNERFDYMSKATRERIETSIAALNYVPNPIARSLKTDKTKTIGVIVRNITGFYTSQVLRGIDDFCKGSQYNVLIYNTDFDPETEARSLKALKAMRVDGLIIASSGKNFDVISSYIDAQFPLVQFQLEYDECHSNIVVSDYRKAAFQATEYLIQLGHKQIAFLTQEFEGIRSRDERYQGYIAALNKYKITSQNPQIYFWDRDRGFQTPLSDMLSAPEPPTAIFSQHLAITIDVLKACEHLTLQIPTDISLLGFDEVPMVEHFKVPITVIRQDPYQVGVQSAKLLLENIINGPLEPQKIIIPCNLVERDSCQKHQGASQ
jgi:DNA-binding LacI/PurR family transcriptional regulator